MVASLDLGTREEELDRYVLAADLLELDPIVISRGNVVKIKYCAGLWSNCNETCGKSYLMSDQIRTSTTEKLLFRCDRFDKSL